MKLYWSGRGPRLGRLLRSRITVTPQRVRVAFTTRRGRAGVTSSGTWWVRLWRGFGVKR